MGALLHEVKEWRGRESGKHRHSGSTRPGCSHTHIDPVLLPMYPGGRNKLEGGMSFIVFQISSLLTDTYGQRLESLAGFVQGGREYDQDRQREEKHPYSSKIRKCTE